MVGFTVQTHCLPIGRWRANPRYRSLNLGMDRSLVLDMEPMWLDKRARWQLMEKPDGAE